MIFFLTNFFFVMHFISVLSVFCIFFVFFCTFDVQLVNIFPRVIIYN